MFAAAPTTWDWTYFVFVDHTAEKMIIHSNLRSSSKFRRRKNSKKRNIELAATLEFQLHRRQNVKVLNLDQKGITHCISIYFPSPKFRRHSNKAFQWGLIRVPLTLKIQFRFWLVLVEPTSTYHDDNKLCSARPNYNFFHWHTAETLLSLYNVFCSWFT